MVNVFLDTEFTGLHQKASLISLGMVAESGEMFYAEFNDFPKLEITPWLKEHVIARLSGNLPEASEAPSARVVLMQGDWKAVAAALKVWLTQFGGKNSVRIWADVLAWDWVLFCELFGGAFGIPEQLHYIPCDLSTLLWARGLDPDADREKLAGDIDWNGPPQHLGRHHALYDALLEKEIFLKLKS